jgi:hypothetical protein
LSGQSKWQIRNKIKVGADSESLIGWNPIPHPRIAEPIYGSSCNQDESGGPHLAQKVRPRKQNENEPAEREQYRQRVKGHTKSSQLAFPAMLGKKSRRPLQQKLKQDPDYHKGRDNLLQSKDAAHERYATQR